MRSASLIVTAAVLAGSVGCGGRRGAEPEPQARPPEPPLRVPVREYDPEKPMPGSARAGDVPPEPFNDEPLVTQRPPEQRAFVEAYQAVGRPRIVVFVNRTPAGEYEAAREDESDLRAIDYDAMENILTDWLSAGGRVDVQSALPQDREPNAEAKRAGADVLVRVQARPTRQTPTNFDIRIVAEAVNIGRGGQTVARAVVDVPPPLDKPQMNRYTRFLARKLMDGMTGSWHEMARGDGPEPAPAARPPDGDR